MAIFTTDKDVFSFAPHVPMVLHQAGGAE